MNKFLNNSFVFLCFFIAFVLFFKLNLNTGNFYHPPININELEEYKDVNSANKVLESVKSRFSRINSLSARNVKIYTKRLSASGEIHYEGKNLRLIVNSFLGKEMDIGSNSKIFWFWSRRIRPQALYYSKHEDIYKTSLRPMFNRDWLLDCFIIGRFEEYEGLDFFELKNSLVVKQLKKVSEKDYVYLVTVISLIDHTVSYKCICDTQNYVMAYVRYSDFDKNFVPRTIDVHWCEEGISMKWIIKDVQINVPINSSLWIPPKYEPKVDMSLK